MPKQVFHQFIAAINEHNVEQLVALMTDDHIFIDANNHSLTGIAGNRMGWKIYFDWFPDYNVEVEKIFADGNEIAAFGFAEGTYHNLKEEGDKAHWRRPAAWKMVVRDQKVAQWQVYADTFLPWQIISSHDSPTMYSDKINGIGGVFFKSADPKALCKWYDEHLGTQFGENDYTLFRWCQRENRQHIGTTTFAVFKANSDYFEPSEKQFMFNFRVNDLDALLQQLKTEGVQVIEKTETFDYGKFGWIMDPEGNKIELWEPRNEELFDPQE